MQKMVRGRIRDKGRVGVRGRGRGRVWVRGVGQG